MLEFVPVSSDNVSLHVSLDPFVVQQRILWVAQRLVRNPNKGDQHGTTKFIDHHS